MVDKIKDAEIQEILKGRKWQLNALDLDVKSEVDLNLTTKPDQSKQAETWDKDNTYHYVPEDFSLTEGGDANRIERDYKDVEMEPKTAKDDGLINIFKRGKLWKHMDEVLNLGNDKDRAYNINLDTEHGLAGLVLYVQQQ